MKLTDLQLNQMIASGGIDCIAAKHIIHLQKTIDIASKCMKEKQDTIEYLKGRVSLMEGMIDEGVGWEDMERDL